MILPCSCDRQQAAWLRRRCLEGRRCCPQWLCTRSRDCAAEEDRQAGQIRIDRSDPSGRDDFLKAEGKKRGEYLFNGRRGPNQPMTTRQYARLLGDWMASIGLDKKLFGTHSLRRTKATLIYRRTGKLASRSAPARSHEDRKHSQILGHRGGRRALNRRTG